MCICGKEITGSEDKEERSMSQTEKGFRSSVKYL